VATDAYQPWLHRYAVLVACCTLLLIVAGAMVTSTGSGLAVPDWPTTYGQNMFTFPPSKWVGGIFFEHGHRLIASGVGMLTIGLAVWLHCREPRRWLRRLGFVALGLVVAQGILGGLTVKYLLPTPISVLHGCTAQAFFCITIAIAVFTSRAWLNDRRGIATAARAAVPRLWMATTAVVFMQLVLGAIMRHSESGRAVLDFPLAYGQVFPDLSETAVENYNIERQWDLFLPPVTASQIAWHMAHRFWAVAVAVVVVAACVVTLRRHGDLRGFTWPALAALGLLVVQIGLGAWTVWSGKQPYVTSAHVAVGAATLGTVWLLTLRARRHLSVASSSELPAMVLTGAAG
jgi:cytochrome c oxidase assembly protein subunit 15